MIGWTETIIQGLLLGGLYALFATGLSLAFGVMRMVNIAHGDFIILAAFVALLAVDGLGIGALWSLLLVVPVMALFGYLLQRGVLNLTLGDDIMPPLLVTFGLAIIIQNVLLEVFTANSRGLPMEGLVTQSVALGPISVGTFPLLILATAVAVLTALHFFFARTATGRAFRATSDDREVASLMGVDNRHIYALAMALAMAIVAIGGIYFGIRSSFTPLDGPGRLLIAFEVVIIGGLGSIWGTLVGGMVLGLAHVIGFRLNPGWGILLGHLVFLAILVLRPQGLFPKTRDR